MQHYSHYKKATKYLKRIKGFLVSIPIIAIILFIFSLGCVFTAFIQKPEYKSYTTLLLTKEQTGSALTITDVNLNKSLVDTYRELIKSKKIAKEVIFNLNLDV